MPNMTATRAAFLDRDGTINVKAPDGEYVTSPTDLVLLEGAADGIRRLNDAGFLVIVVTNQRGIALSRMTEANLDAVHRRLVELLAVEAGAVIDAIFHCPHNVSECLCRKPDPGMLVAAHQRFPTIEPRHSVMIGDSASDVEAGRRFGVPTIWLGRDVRDLGAAVDRVLGTPLT